MAEIGAAVPDYYFRDQSNVREGFGFKLIHIDFRFGIFQGMPVHIKESCRQVFYVDETLVEMAGVFNFLYKLIRDRLSCFKMLTIHFHNLGC